MNRILRRSGFFNNALAEYEIIDLYASWDEVEP